MKFDIESAASAEELNGARQSVGRTCKIAKIVVWSSAAALLALVYPFGKWLIGLLAPLAPDDGVIVFFWPLLSVLNVFFACAYFVICGLYLARWPFKTAIEMHRLLQPLDVFEASRLVSITETHSELDKYRRSVASVREFVKGDYELIRDLEQAALKQAQDAKRDHVQQVIFTKLYRPE